METAPLLLEVRFSNLTLSDLFVRLTLKSGHVQSPSYSAFKLKGSSQDSFSLTMMIQGPAPSLLELF